MAFLAPVITVFFTSPDGSEEWLIYHGNSSPTDGCSGTRAARAQPFTWYTEGDKKKVYLTLVNHWLIKKTNICT